jgi:hypothetical protein
MTSQLYSASPNINPQDLKLLNLGQRTEGSWAKSCRDLGFPLQVGKAVVCFDESVSSGSDNLINFQQPRKKSVLADTVGSVLLQPSLWNKLREVATETSVISTHTWQTAALFMRDTLVLYQGSLGLCNTEVVSPVVVARSVFDQLAQAHPRSDIGKTLGLVIVTVDVLFAEAVNEKRQAVARAQSNIISLAAFSYTGPRRGI